MKSTTNGATVGRTTTQNNRGLYWAEELLLSGILWD